MQWTEEKLKDLAARALTEFPYPLGKARRNLITKSRYRPMSQDKRAWSQYHIGLRAYIVIFDTMLTGCRHSAQWLLPGHPLKAEAMYQKLRHARYDYNNDVVNDPEWEMRQAERHPNYSPLDIPQEFPDNVDITAERYSKLNKPIKDVRLHEEDRPPAPVKRLTAEEYYKAKEMENSAKVFPGKSDKI